MHEVHITIFFYTHTQTIYKYYFPAKIQGLKKSCVKGDKKKKKEVTEEIARLEAELDKRHEEEARQFQCTESINLKVCNFLL